MQKHKKKKVFLQRHRIILGAHFSSRYFGKGTRGNQVFPPQKISLKGNNKPFIKKSVIKRNFNFNKSLPKVSVKSSYSIYIHATKRNTRLSFCKSDGSHIFSYTMGSLGYKKSKRGQTYFIKDLCVKFLGDLRKYGVSSYVLYVNGFGRSRRPIINFFSRSKLRYKCSYILDVTPKAYNGCRSRIQRRL
jgi:ribosomal protein S11